MFFNKILFFWKAFNINNNKKGLQPVSKPAEQPLLGFKTVGERVLKSATERQTQRDNKGERKRVEIGTAKGFELVTAGKNIQTGLAAPNRQTFNNKFGHDKIGC